MERVAGEHWFGATVEFIKSYRASVFLRGMSDELSGQKSRAQAWVGLVISRSY